MRTPSKANSLAASTFLADLEQDLEQRFSGLRHLLESTDRINPGVLLEETFRLLFERLRLVLPCDAIQLILLDEGKNRLELRAELRLGEEPGDSSTPEERPGEECAVSLLWNIISAGHLHVLADLPAQAVALRSSVFLQRLAGNAMRWGLVVPLASAGRHLGAVIVATQVPASIAESTMQDIEAHLAGLASLVAKAKLYELVIRSQLDSERLLRNVLPDPIVKRLKAGEQVIADGIPEATVVFVDIVDFVQLSSSMSPASVIIVLNRIFSAFDALCEQYGVEKIKTIGDAYMLATGVPRPFPEHVRVAARIALDMQELSRRLGMREERFLNFRIGIHTGPVVAGVIGTRKFSYDLWGDTVNIASRMEAHGMPGRIHVTQAVYEKLQADFDFESRGDIEVKGMGRMKTYFLLGPKAGNSYRSVVWSMLSPALVQPGSHDRRSEDD